MANLYCGLVMKLIDWKSDVIRNDVIFRDVTPCSMATIFLWGFDVLILWVLLVKDQSSLWDTLSSVVRPSVCPAVCP